MSKMLRRHSHLALFAAGALLFAGSPGAQRSPVPGGDYGPINVDQEVATEPASQSRAAQRRVRASLTMPYFSFAQALNSRS
jgi:hypothetical protein